MRHNDFQVRKVYSHIIKKMGFAYFIRTPEKIEEPVWKRTGMPILSATAYNGYIKLSLG